MVLFLFTGVRATQLLISELSPDHRPGTWHGVYDEILPYLQRAFSINLSEVRKSFTDTRLGEEIVDVYIQMCDPNIATRGDKNYKSKYGSRFSMQRFISQFDRLRSEAILGRIRDP